MCVEKIASRRNFDWSLLVVDADDDDSWSVVYGYPAHTWSVVPKDVVIGGLCGLQLGQSILRV